MQDFNTPKQAEGASLSRRTFISIAAAGTAATLPAVACAAAGPVSQLPHVTIEEQLDACVEQLRSILQQMHPTSEIHSHWLSRRQDGSYRFTMSGDPDHSAAYTGEGVYEISIDGYIDTYWLETDCERYRSTGEPIPGMEFYWAARWEKGSLGNEMRRMWSPRIIRKLPEVLL